jgi:hypothetical protein
MTEQWKRIYRAGGFPILAVILASCGGGSDVPGQCYSPTGAVCSAVGVPRSFPEPILSAAGLYRGVTSNGRTIAGLVLDDNSFYAIYSGFNNPAAAAGSIRGTLRPDQGKFTITDAIDTSLDGMGTQLASVTGTFGSKQFLNGTINYPGLKQSISFSANYSSDYELRPDLSIIAGNYSGASAIGTVAEAATFEINGTGNITGKGASGCSFSGTIQPRSSGNAYSVTLTFGGAPCSSPGASASGVSYFDRTSNVIYAVGSMTGQTTGFMATATKQ